MLGSYIPLGYDFDGALELPCQVVFGLIGKPLAWASCLSQWDFPGDQG